MKVFLILIVLIFSVHMNGQNITFIYETKIKVNPKINDYNISSYYLDVLGLQSAFRSEVDRKSDSLVQKTSFGLGRKMTFNNQLYLKKNLVNKAATKVITTPAGRNFDLRIKEFLKWEILPEKIKISDYECQKAVVNYGGRNWTAWFTQAISIQDGPYVFYGLPGLIIKVSDDKDEFDFNLVKVQKSNQNNMFALRRGKEISWEEYRKLQINYFNDPFSEVKSMNVKYQVVDGNGQPISLDLRTMTQSTQKLIKDSNNPVEINEMVIYK